MTRSPDSACRLFGFFHIRKDAALDACLSFLLLCPLLLSGCAKVGAPHPPLVLIPEPATELACRQYSDQVILTVPLPVRNTDGSPATVPGAVEVWRKIEDRKSARTALAEAKFLAEAEMILSVAGDKLAPFRRGARLEFHDRLSLANRTQIYDKSFRYAVRFVNRKRQRAGLSNQAVVALVPIPPAPGNLIAETTQDFIRLRWSAPAENMDGSVPARIAGYNIYRSEDESVFPSEPLNQKPVPDRVYEDRSFQFDKKYYYSVSIVGSAENPPAESPASPVLMVLARDTFPPGAPQNLNAVAAGTAVLLLWVAPPERDLAGYRIYRREGKEGVFSPLQQELVKVLNYRDDNVRKGGKYTYRVTAVDTHDNEGQAAEAEMEVP